MTDSGANMVKAFKSPNPKSNMFAISTEDSDSSNDEDLNVEDETEDITFYCNSDSDEESDDDSSEIDIESSLAFTDQFNATLDGFLKKAETRRNYWVDALRRLVETFARSCAQNGQQRRKKVHTKNSDQIGPQKIKEMVALLQPFADLTDTLQGDGVTSSILIPSIVSKLKLLNSVEEKYFANLKIEIVTNPIYLLVAALDPRIKLNTFKLKDMLETGGLSLPTYVEAYVTPFWRLEILVELKLIHSARKLKIVRISWMLLTMKQCFRHSANVLATEVNAVIVTLFWANRCSKEVNLEKLAKLIVYKLEAVT
ncbi:unnamed protein product [Allacma fusca]|uniref:Uncharacterized protein n=1 Tax=Allacma fusca TaxID=39272 RepID=A0A8J2LWC0_9HEXA|nr:unnamed protein product [Allacma fusca]